MKAPIFTLAAMLLAFAGHGQTSTNGFAVTGPTEDLASKKMLEHFLQESIASASADYAAACVRVVHDARRKALLIFALAPLAETGVFKCGDLEVDVVFCRELLKQDSAATGAFHQHSNRVVLSYATWQYASGNRELALSLMRRLANADQTLTWSSPSHRRLTIQEIIAGLEKADGSVEQYVKEDSEWWSSRVEEFGK